MPERLVKAAPEARVIVLLWNLTRARITAGNLVGASAHLPKVIPKDQLVDAIRANST